MPRRARATPGGLVYHVLNRTVAGLPLFRKEGDYEAFERIMIEAHQQHPLRILAWCPSHLFAFRGDRTTTGPWIMRSAR